MLSASGSPGETLGKQSGAWRSCQPRLRRNSAIAGAREPLVTLCSPYLPPRVKLTSTSPSILPLAVMVSVKPKRDSSFLSSHFAAAISASSEVSNEVMVRGSFQEEQRKLAGCRGFEPRTIVKVHETF